MQIWCLRPPVIEVLPSELPLARLESSESVVDLPLAVANLGDATLSAYIQVCTHCHDSDYFKLTKVPVFLAVSNVLGAPRISINQMVFATVHGRDLRHAESLARSMGNDRHFNAR